MFPLPARYDPRVVTPQFTPITTTEMHSGGEPVRIIESGYPAIPGRTILDKRQYVLHNLDHLRKFLMFEPRGHFDMYGVIPVEPDHPDADMAVLFMHNEGYSTMCGHATIALGRYAVDRGNATAGRAQGGVYRAGLERTRAGTNLVLPSLATRARHLGESRMLNSKITFVVGAGASNEVGLPTGRELTTKIAKMLDIKFSDFGEQHSGDKVICRALGEHWCGEYE